MEEIVAVRIESQEKNYNFKRGHEYILVVVCLERDWVLIQDLTEGGIRWISAEIFQNSRGNYYPSAFIFKEVDTQSCVFTYEGIHDFFGQPIFMIARTL